MMALRPMWHPNISANQGALLHPVREVPQQHLRQRKAYLLRRKTPLPVPETAWYGSLRQEASITAGMTAEE